MVTQQRDVTAQNNYNGQQAERGTRYLTQNTRMEMSNIEIIDTIICVGLCMYGLSLPFQDRQLGFMTVYGGETMTS